MHILHTVLNTISKAMARRTCFNNLELLPLVIISFFLVTCMCDFGGGYCKEKLDAGHSQGFKGWGTLQSPTRRTEHEVTIVYFTIAWLVAKPLNRCEAMRVTLLWYKPCCFSNVNYFVIMLTRYWSLSQQGHLQPHSKSKAWQLSTPL